MHLLFNPHNTPGHWVLFPHVGTDASFLGPEIYAVWVALLKEKTKQNKWGCPTWSNTTRHRVEERPCSWKETSVSSIVVALPYSYRLYKTHDHINTLPRFSCVGTEKSYLEAFKPQKNPLRVGPFHRGKKWGFVTTCWISKYLHDTVEWLEELQYAHFSTRKYGFHIGAQIDIICYKETALKITLATLDVTSLDITHGKAFAKICNKW